ncbi:MAG: acyl-CoA reductase [Flavobacteriales bacterium]|nr:acyl-CoA reductase [Flavobacteriales bacterium]MCB0757894.1 acyl-CoA reductase [Flavobacteriales bacterium]
MSNRTPAPRTSGPATRISAFAQLGRALELFANRSAWPGHSSGLTEDEYNAFDTALDHARVRNGWFTEEQVRFAARGLARMLDQQALENWLANYPGLDSAHAPRTIGIIMAGNIPFVGFHDLLCVLLCGHRAKVKVASDDAGLTPALIRLLACFSPEMADQVEVADGRLGEVDAIIATGSDNTARYFEHYFGHLPRIIRKSRTSVAVLDGSESEAELAALGEDVFRYFGLGCRNVGKVFIPQDFDLDRLFGAIFSWKEIINHHKYANNYDYHKAVWMLDRAPIVENGFLIVKEDKALNSPVAALYYERYADASTVEARLREEKERLQCIVGHGHTPFGEAQYPGPGEYADNVDTMKFLLELDQGGNS